MSDFSSRWIKEFERLLLRRKHILLHGNVHDQFLWRGRYLSVFEFLDTCLREMDFNLIVRFDPTDGFNFTGQIAPPALDAFRKSHPSVPPLPTGLQERFAELVRRGIVARQAEVDGGLMAPTAAVVQPENANPVVPPPRALPSAAMGSPRPRRLAPEEALAELRLTLAQSELPLAAILDLGDMLTASAAHYGAEERHTLMLLKKCTLEAAIIQEGALQGYANTLVIQASDLKRVPEWFYRDNPHVALVQVGRPDKEERRMFAMNHIRPGRGTRGFFGGEAIQAESPSPRHASELELLAEEFSDLTDGLQTIDLHALRFSSWQNRIPLRRKQVARLVDHFKFGVTEDPWEMLHADKVRQARQVLAQRVMGQPKAVEMVTNLLISARVGLKMSGGRGSTQPKGVFFFVGPTGVGKTELAKALTELVFGDERAFARFDMSEYKEEHAAEKLAGAPPGFVGYEAGGQLTNRVMAHPHSILLFDEIEKAHPKVLDKFLQILEDGRLTDGQGQTAYFHQTVIIFTSNIGASDLSDPQTGQLIRPGIMRQVQLAGTTHDFSRERVEDHFRQEVAWYFTSRIGRVELLNRLGDNIVVFDMLRPEYIKDIGRKFVEQLALAARDKYQLTLEIDQSIYTILSAEMAKGDHLLFGGRRIRSILETLLERPLNRYLFETSPDPRELSGLTLRLTLNDHCGLDVQRVCTDHA
ncbi:MAG: ATP-dependent Clp protease ATP-binding subunit [Magnetococcales bacterium]|nr:ATP-dependent Clp protease ATP-binding subunit [Magnetococcales bacterium]